MGPRAIQDGFCRRIENILPLLERIGGSCIYSYTNMYFMTSGHAEEGFLGQAVCVSGGWLLRLSSASVLVPMGTYTVVFTAADMRSSHTIHIT